MTSSTFVDSSRGTPARNGVPASNSRTIHELVYAPSGPATRLPVVVFAPGWDAQSADYDPLLRAAASAGYIVVGVDSPGTSSYFPGTPISSDLANVTIDLSAALTNVESGALGSRIDRFEVAAMGHSDGGSAVANLALNTRFRSSRFNAYVVLAGVVPTGQVPGSFGAVNNGPVLAMVGTADEYANYTPQPGGNGTETVYETAGRSKIFVTVSGGTHLGPFVGSGTQADDTRSAIVAFLDVAETHQAGAGSTLQSAISSDGLSAQQDLNLGFGSPRAVGLVATSDGQGYWLAEDDGVVRAYGDAAPLGGATTLVAPIVAIAATPSGKGYWLADAVGDIYHFGDAGLHGNASGLQLAAPIVAMAGDPATGGYWLLGGDGGVFSYSAPFYGSTGNIRLVAPALGMAASGDGGGYWFVAADGGVFSYGDARFQGSMGNVRLARPMVGMARDPATSGYWLVAADGGIFSFGAPFYGSAGNLRLAAPVVGMAARPSGDGYWLLGADGGVFAYGSAPFRGAGL